MDYPTKQFWGELIARSMQDYGAYLPEDFLTLCTLSKLPREGVEASLQYFEANVWELEYLVQSSINSGMPC